MNENPSSAPGRRLRTAEVAAAVGYSVQQVRDLERLGVIPPAIREGNGYRTFSSRHLSGVRAYRDLAAAVGPVVARHTMREVRALPLEQAVAVINSLHVGLARDREDALVAQRALHSIHAEATGSPGVTEDDTLTITELADALGVRSSTLRFWEQSGLIVPERVTSYAARRYPPAAVREARITAALRAAGYRIPDVYSTIQSIRRHEDLDNPLGALDTRLNDIAGRMLALLSAGSVIVESLKTDAAPGGADG